MPEQLLRRALDELKAGRPPVLVTVTASEGSTPRKAGSAMLVGERGYLCGTVGGGNLEHWCVGHAFEEIGNHRFFRLDNEKAAEYGMICGGNVWILFTPLEEAAPLEQALEQLEQHRPAWLLLPLGAGKVSCEPNARLPREPQRLEREGEEYVSLCLGHGRRIWLLGGGHVAHSFAALLDYLGYPYFVWDDRPDFSNPERYPNALDSLSCPVEELPAVFSKGRAPGEEDLIYVMTRGHLSDGEALTWALTTPVERIGLIGSRRKREKVFAQMKELGFSDVEARVTTPVGLPIGAQTPEEIAVSMAAQLIGWERGTL